MITNSINAVMANSYRNNIKANNNKQRQNFGSRQLITTKAVKAPSNSLGEIISGLIKKFTK
jgi:hypothetical protein